MKRTKKKEGTWRTPAQAADLCERFFKEEAARQNLPLGMVIPVQFGGDQADKIPLTAFVDLASYNAAVVSRMRSKIYELLASANAKEIQDAGRDAMAQLESARSERAKKLKERMARVRNELRGHAIAYLQDGHSAASATEVWDRVSMKSGMPAATIRRHLGPMAALRSEARAALKRERQERMDKYRLR